MQDTVLTATAYLLPAAREKLLAEGLDFPHPAVSYVVSDLSQETPARVLRNLTGGTLATLSNSDFAPTRYA